MEGIIIVGYGRMGKEIEDQATKMGITVCAVADNRKELQDLGQNAELRAGRVAIEFTSGAAAVQNLHYLLSHDIPVVSGSTPLFSSAEPDKNCAALLELRRQRQGYLMFSSNYSIGVNIFWRVVRQTSRLIDNFPQYDLSIYEQHHDKKIDSPSGTAVSTAEIVLQEVARKSKILCGNPKNADGSYRAIAAEELQLSSQRFGHVVGVHQLLCDSPEDSIVVSHNAHNRAGFARGAIIAAQFLQQQVTASRPSFFTMDDLIDYFLQNQKSFDARPV